MWRLAVLALLFAVAAGAATTPAPPPPSTPAPNDDADIRFVLLVHRHGARTPNAGPPSSDFKWIWPDGPTRLTTRGLADEYQEGVRFQQRYVKELGLIEANGLEAQLSDLVVYAADSDVAQQSAGAVLRGMFGMQGGRDESEDLQTVPVHGAGPRAMDGWRTCPTTRDLQNQMHADPDWVHYEQSDAWQAVRRELDKLGFGNWSLGDIGTLADWMLCANYTPDGLHAALPARMSASPLLLRAVPRVGAWVRTAPFLLQSINGLGQLTSSAIISAALSQMQLLTQGDTVGRQRMLMYFAHSENVMGMLRQLRLFDLLTEPPAFNATLALELWQRRRDSEMIVRVLYGSKQYAVPNCPDAGDCTLRTFLQMNAPLVNVSTTNNDWDALCARALDACSSLLVPPSPPSSSGFRVPFLSFAPLWVTAGALSGAVAVVMLALVAWRWWRNRHYRSRQATIAELEIN